MKKGLLRFILIMCGIMLGCWTYRGKIQYSYAADEDIYDIILFWGQSNMSGSVGGKQEETTPDKRMLSQENTGISQSILNNTTAMNHVNVAVKMGTAYDFQYSKLSSDPLVPILSTTKTLGEGLKYKRGKLVAANDAKASLSESQGTNMIPQFCSTYYAKTGHKVIAVMATHNGKPISAFLPTDSSLNPYKFYTYEATKMKYNAAVAYAESKGYKIGSKFWVGYQGESDVENIVTDEDVESYIKKYKLLSDTFSKELGTEFGFLVESASLFRSNSSKIPASVMKQVKLVNVAQKKIVSRNDNIMLGSDFPYRQYFSFNTNVVSNMNNYYHLTSAALSQVGYETALNASAYVNGNFAQSLRLDNSKMTLAKGETVQLDCEVVPDSGLKNNIVFESVNPNVATVDQNGVVSAIKEGSTIIVARTKDGKKMACCTMMVGNVPIRGITLSKEELNLTGGESAVITAQVQPENEGNQSVSWNSSNSYVATVADGVITAQHAGVAYISAVTTGTPYVAACKVVVRDDRTEVTELSAPEADTPKEITEGLPDEEDEMIPVTALEQGAYESALEIGRTCQLSVTCVPENATNQDIIWTSSDETVASVDENGLVCGNAAGEVIITAGAENGSVTTTFSFKVEPVKVSSIAFCQENFYMPVNFSTYIMPEVVPGDAADQNITFSVDNDAVQIDESGKLIAKKPGTVTLTAACGGTLTAACKITVMPCLASEVKIARKSYSLKEGQSTTIKAEVLPAETGNQQLNYLSSDKTVVTVNSTTGKITAKKEGTAVIMAHTTDGSHVFSYCTVTVKKPVVKVQNITVSANKNQLCPGEYVSLHALILPSNATNQNVTWSVDSTDYVRIYSNGTIVAKMAGLDKWVKVTATAKDGSGVKASFDIKIAPAKASAVKISNSSHITKMAAGKSTKLQAVVYPSYTTNKKVTWSSSNPGYATVTDKGVVSVKSEGVGKTIVIKATTQDGSKKSGIYKIRIVRHAVSSVTLSATSDTVKVNKTLKITSKIKTTGADANTVLRWSSSNPEYATVDSSGVVRGCEKGVGKVVTITAATTDGSYEKATYRVKIKR